MCSVPFVKNKINIFWNEWLNIIPVFNKYFIGNTYYSGNFISSNKIDIITCNHINFCDALSIISIIKNFSKKDLYVIMKKDLIKLPIIGIFAKNNLTLERSLEHDKENIINFIKKIENGVILILPEGTRMNKQNFEKSIEYSKNNNLKKYDNLLYPKMKGLDIIINVLNDRNKLGNLIDITLKIDGLKKFNTSPLHFIKNATNTFCHINSYKINKNTLNNYDNLKIWYLMIWDRKEEYLNNYNNNLYKKFNYDIKSSTFILNIVMLNLCILYYNVFLKSSFINKNKIVIE